MSQNLPWRPTNLQGREVLEQNILYTVTTTNNDYTNNDHDNSNNNNKIIIIKNNSTTNTTDNYNTIMIKMKLVIIKHGKPTFYHRSNVIWMLATYDVKLLLKTNLVA